MHCPPCFPDFVKHPLRIERPRAAASCYSVFLQQISNPPCAFPRESKKAEKQRVITPSALPDNGIEFGIHIAPEDFLASW